MADISGEKEKIAEDLKKVNDELKHAKEKLRLNQMRNFNKKLKRRDDKIRELQHVNSDIIQKETMKENVTSKLKSKYAEIKNLKAEKIREQNEASTEKAF